MLNRIFKAAAVAAILATHVGCTSLQSLPKTCNGGPCVAALSAGDVVVVTTQDRNEIAMTVSQSDAAQLVGLTNNKNTSSRSVTVAAADIVDIQKREFSAGKTVGLVVAVAAVIGIIAAVSVGKGLGGAMVNAAGGAAG